MTRFKNTLSRVSLARIERLVGLARNLTEPTKTRALIEQADIGADEKGAVGALRMLDLVQLIHSRPGGGRQLIWYPGPRPVGVSVPQVAGLMPYCAIARRLQDGEWCPTDLLLAISGKAPPGTPLDGLSSRSTAGLPVRFFVDNGKSGRKSVLGALKALCAIDYAEWRNHSSQAIEWRWTGPSRTGLKLPCGPSYTPPQSMTRELNGEEAARQQRLAQGTRRRMAEFEDARQAWRDEQGYPAAKPPLDEVIKGP